MLQVFSLLLFAALLSATVSVWIAIIDRLRAGKPILAFKKRTAILRDPLLFAIILAYILWPKGTPADIRLELVKMACLIQAAIVAMLVFLLYFAGRGRLLPFGFSFSNFRSQLITASLGFAASILPVAMIAVGMFLLGLRSEETQHQFLQLVRESQSVVAVFWVALSAIILAPICEELIYRVILQGWLQTWIEPKSAILATALFFCLAHSLADTLPLFPLAIILGYVYYKTNSFWTVVLLHAEFNAANLLILLLSPA